MSQRKDKLVGGTIFLLCLGILFVRGLFSDSTIASTITVEESRAMYLELGGQPDAKPVTMFVTSWCSVCVGLQQRLIQEKIPYIHVDLEKNREAMLFYQRVTQGQTSSVPVTVVGAVVVVGYDISSILNAYRSLPM